jgi:hypothetical protein
MNRVNENSGAREILPVAQPEALEFFTKPDVSARIPL